MTADLIGVAVVVGLLAGWLADVAMKSGGYGLIGDLLLGVGGGIVGQILAAVLTGAAAPDMAGAAGGLDIGTLIRDVVGGGAGGAVVTAIVGAVRNAMMKS